jgi:hypothetical protein
MADALAFPIEQIPDSSAVFMRAHETYYRDGDLTPGVFTAKEGGMSVDWDKYCSKEETKQRAKKNPEKNAVLSLSVGGIRKIDDLDVKHRPEPDNRAHSEVDLPANREKLTEVRLLLKRLAQTVIPFTGS